MVVKREIEVEEEKDEKEGDEGGEGDDHGKEEGLVVVDASGEIREEGRGYEGIWKRG